jgi:hypothetical protein
VPFVVGTVNQLARGESDTGDSSSPHPNDRRERRSFGERPSRHSTVFPAFRSPSQPSSRMPFAMWFAFR